MNPYSYVATQYKRKPRFNPEACKELMAVVVKAFPPKNKLRGEPAIRRIAEIVCGYYHMPIEWVVMKTRKRAFLKPRQIISYFCRVDPCATLVEIAAFFSQDHTSVLNSCNVVSDRIDTEKDFAGEIAAIKMLLY